jgi:hypothetical protein
LQFVEAIPKSDVCGVAPLGRSFLASSGNSGLSRLDELVSSCLENSTISWVWDNHMLSLNA